MRLLYRCEISTFMPEDLKNADMGLGDAIAVWMPGVVDLRAITQYQSDRLTGLGDCTAIVIDGAISYLRISFNEFHEMYRRNTDTDLPF